MKSMRALVGVVGLLASSAASAQVSNEMQSMFNDLGSISNVTKPGMMNGTLEGGISGGSIVIRNSNMSPSLFSFNPPVFGAGCGGLDLFGGSFSMISKQQMTAYMRQIAASAETYAFDLALKALCPMCASDMQKLQEWTQAMNRSNLSSCNIAEAAVNSTGLANLANTNYQNWLASQNGSGSDNLANASQGPGLSSPTSLLALQNPALANQIFTGNLVWQALQKGNVSGQFTGGNNNLMQDIMSLTGTLIICEPGLGACNAPSVDTSNRPGQLQTTTVLASADISDLVEGTSGGSTVNLLVCDDQTNCFNPKPTAQSNFNGFAQLIRTEFLGDANGDPGTVVGGLIGKIAYQSGALSSTDISYLQALGEFGGQVRNLALHDPIGARLFVERYADSVAAEFVYNMARDYINAAATAVGQLKQDYTGSGLKMLTDARAKLDMDYAKLKQPVNAASGQLAYYTQMMDSMTPSLLPSSIQRDR